MCISGREQQRLPGRTDATHGPLSAREGMSSMRPGARSPVLLLLLLLLGASRWFPEVAGREKCLVRVAIPVQLLRSFSAAAALCLALLFVVLSPALTSSLGLSQPRRFLSMQSVRISPNASRVNVPTSAMADSGIQTTWITKSSAEKRARARVKTHRAQ